MLCMSAAPASAIVGGSDASPGEYPSTAKVTFGAFGCTGTLIAPDTVLRDELGLVGLRAPRHLHAVVLVEVELAEAH